MAWSIDWSCPCPRDEVGSFPGRKVSRRFSWSRYTSPRSRTTSQTWRTLLVYPLKSQTNRYWCSIKQKWRAFEGNRVQKSIPTTEEMFSSYVGTFRNRTNTNDTLGRRFRTDSFMHDKIWIPNGIFD